MSSRWNGLFSRIRHASPQPVEGPAIVRWLDTTPVESTDVPCTVESLDVTARVSGLFAEVEQTLVIHNPNGRPLSVELAIPLPDRAIVCGYALEIDGQIRDGVVVEKEKARIAFETEQRRGADPGMVEAVRGNVYRTRVYPVPAKGTRSVRLRYVSPLLLASDGSAVLDLPMPPERLAKRSVRVDVQMLDCPRPTISGLGNAMLQEARGYWSASVEERNVQPSEHVRVAMPQLPASFALIERDNEGDVWFCASAADPRPAAYEPVTLTHLTVLWDASGSHEQANRAKELELLQAYCSSPSIEFLRLVVFGERVREVHAFSSAGELVEHVRGLRYDGGTDLVELARTTKDLFHACDGIANGAACVLFTDGLDTMAEDFFTLPDGCDAIAIISGSERDAEALRRACKGRVFDLDLAPKDADELSDVLAHPASHGVLGLGGSGIADVCDAGSVGAGRRAVMGRLLAEHTQLTFEGQTPLELDAGNAGSGRTLACAWAARRVALISSNTSQNANELLRLGKRFGVVSPATSLLVLETVDQWIRYDLEPPTSWTSMHEQWTMAQKSAMSLGPMRNTNHMHRRNLVREWKALRQWWNRDFSSMTPISTLYCHSCGTPLEPDTRFCPHCGSPAYRNTYNAPTPESSTGGASLQTAPQDDAQPPLPRMARPIASPSRMGSLREFADSAEALPTVRSAAPTAHVAARMARSAAPAAAARSAAPVFANNMAYAEESSADSTGSISVSPAEMESSTRVTIRPWMPNTPYLSVLDKSFKRGIEAAREAYFGQRAEFRTSPSFFLDCAGWFMSHEDATFAVQVLSNLAELRIEDAALLRVMGWRLREAGELERALVALRRAMRLRKEDGQGHRDVALVLDELARSAFASGNEDAARAHAQAAGELYRKTALTPWLRHPLDIALFAVEEYNVLRAWADEQQWSCAPELPSLGEDLEGVLACDLRITLAWDADETDVDIHVTEPSGEEAYYANRNTQSGGRVSKDITDGYGPELYEIKTAQNGTYRIRAHYFASHQQTVFGPATCTLTVYSDWGRPQQIQQITTTRLSSQKEMIPVGTASYGNAAEADSEDDTSRDHMIRCGMSADEVAELLGNPDERETAENGDVALVWNRTGDHKFVVVVSDGVVLRILEQTSWGDMMIIEQ